VSITGNGSGVLRPGDRIQEQLNNSDNTYGYVVYEIIPWTLNASGNRKCEGPVIRDTVWVEPTPRLILSVPLSTTNEQIYCNGTPIEFTVQNNQQLIGNIKYDFEVFGSDLPLFTGNSSSELGKDIGNFTDTLSHSEDVILELYYRFLPYIEHTASGLTCGGVADTLIIQMVPVLKSLVAETDTVYGGFNITCKGYSDGMIHLDPVGGDYRYDYNFEWREDDAAGTFLDATVSEKTDSLQNLTAGTYYYAITDTLGCFHDSIRILIEPDTLEIAADLVEQASCYTGTSDGSIYLLDVRGGAYTYTYLYEWYNRADERIEATTRDLENVTTGGYDITIEDRNGCIYESTYWITAPEQLRSQLDFQRFYGNYNVRCFGEANAEMVAGGIGGTEPYRYEWYTDNTGSSPFSTEDAVSGLPAGTYYYSVIDDNGCSTVEYYNEVVVTEPDPITFARDPADKHPGDWDISCYGLADGEINLAYFGGHTEYLANDFAWTAAAGGSGLAPTDSVQSGLTAGEYTVTVTDAFGCTDNTTFTLEQPAQIVFDYDLKTYVGDSNISCYGLSDGEIQLINLSGGGPRGDEGDGPEDYSYSWMPPIGVTLPNDTLKDQIGVPAGQYTVRVTDAIGCAEEGSVTLSQPDPLSADTLVDRTGSTGDKNGYAIKCFGFSDGEIALVPSGGTRAYSYAWSGPEGVITGDTILLNLSAGIYQVEISDPNNCKVAYEFRLEQPDTIILNEAPEFIKCFGDPGSIYLDPEGGNTSQTGGYRYSWEGGSTSRDLTGMPAGTYTVSVTDDNNCLVTDSIELLQSPEIITELAFESNYAGGTHIKCEGDSTGALSVSAFGGNPGYNYNWYQGTNGEAISTGSSVSNIPAGWYFVEVTDQYACEVSDSIFLPEPRAISLEVDPSDPSCPGYEDGEIDLMVFYGTPIYTYLWELPGGETIAGTASLRDIADGDFSVLVTDANGCTIFEEITLQAPDTLKMEAVSSPAECPDETDGSLNINWIQGGTEPYFVNEIPGKMFFDNLAPGNFEINIVDAHGCYLNEVVEIGIINQSCLDIPNAFTPNYDGANDLWVLDSDDDGSNDMYLYPNAELWIYNRWGELVYYTDDVAGEPWDGTFNGRDLPIDSYHYVLDLGNDEPPRRGNVTIVR
jgi:gliding motility-associated-like protein